MFSLSLHELTACVYYKLAIERGLRGSHPDSEKLAHAPRRKKNNSNNANTNLSGTGSPRTAQSGIFAYVGIFGFAVYVVALSCIERYLLGVQLFVFRLSSISFSS